MNGKILFADDDGSALRAWELIFSDRYDVLTATTVEEARKLSIQHEFDVAIVDLNFEGQEDDGIDLIKFIQKNRPLTAIVVLSGDASTQRVSDAALMRNLQDFIVKSGDNEDRLSLAIERGIQERRARAENQNLFQTRSPLMKNVLQLLEKIVLSPVQSPILIMGEPGTGKEHLARHVGTVTKKNVVTTNMANHRAELADSVLFGHLKGSFTGAEQSRIGLIEAASGGILFLDEIGETNLDVQAKLLRAIQEKEISQVGSSVVKKIDIRFIGATNRDLSAMSEVGLFRKDLLERLSTWILKIPTLRERPEDIVFLTNQFLNSFTKNSTAFRIEPEGMNELLKHSWPGNVRELRNVIERIATVWDARVLDKEAVRYGIFQELDSKVLAPGHNHHESVVSLTKADYINALATASGNITQVARVLGVHRATVYRKLRTWGLPFTMDKPQGKSASEIA